MSPRRGENHPNCCLTDEDVELIRQLYEEGQKMEPAERRRRQLGYKGIAKRFGCSARTVRGYVAYRARI